MREPYIAVVGVCASGKTTLVEGLKREGLKAVNVPQEHSCVKELWRRLHPETNILIMLDAKYETTKRRRPTITYGPDRLEEQHKRLSRAREQCDLYLPTDDLGIEEVRQTVLKWIADWKERSG